MLESIQLDDSVRASEQLHLESAGSPTPLSLYDLRLIKGEGLSTTRRFPAPARLCESSDAMFF